MTDFRATHVVPPEGLAVYAAPDPAQPAGAALDPGLGVEVVETHGAWSRIVCSNGFTGWVDGRRLVAPGTSTVAATPVVVAAAPGTPAWAIVAILVILAATVAGILSTLGGDEDEGGQPVVVRTAERLRSVAGLDLD